MKKSRYSDEQIVRILREADKDPVPEVAKRHGVSEQSIYAWRKRFTGMAVDEVKELKNLAQENARLKKLLAERDLEIDRAIIFIEAVAAPQRGFPGSVVPANTNPPVYQSVAALALAQIIGREVSALEGKIAVHEALDPARADRELVGCSKPATPARGMVKVKAVVVLGFGVNNTSGQIEPFDWRDTRVDVYALGGGRTDVDHAE